MELTAADSQSDPTLSHLMHELYRRACIPNVVMTLTSKVLVQLQLDC